MLKTDYLISGLDSMSMEVSIDGTTHFLNNIVSGWYSIEEVDIAPGGKARLTFLPTREIAPLVSRKRCSLTLSANEAFSLIVREQYSTGDKTTIKYVFLNCLQNDEGRPYFHSETLQKTVLEPIADGRIHIDSTVEKLLSEGYSIIKTVDDKSRSSCMVVLENHRKTA